LAAKKALNEATIEFCMSKALAYVTPDSNVDDAATVMKERDIRSVLVKENGAYVGILTETDLLFEVLIGGNDPKSTKVSSIMTKPIISLDQDKSLKAGVELMRKKNIKHLIVTRKDKIVGMLSIRDLITFSVRNR